MNIAIQEADKIWLMLDDEIVEGASEDLILNETFDKLFSKSNLNFDKVKGDFRMKRKHPVKIGLKGEGMHYNWTKKALERLGYSVVKGDGELLNLVEVQVRNDNCKWILKTNTNHFEFDSIYDLSLRLKNIN